MILSYMPLMEQKRRRIKASITTDHPASSYGMPVIVLDDGDALDYNSAILLNYNVESASQAEMALLDQWRRNMPPIDPIVSSAAALGRKGGSAKTAAKQKASRENGKKGGRPKKKD